MNAAPVAAANRRFWKMVRSSIGAFTRRSIRTNAGSSAAAAASPAMTIGSLQPEIPPLGDAENEAGEADDEGRGAERVIAAALVGLGELAQDERAPGGAGEAERDVEPEDPVPGDGDQRAAEHRAEHEADGGDHRVGAHRQPELIVRERVGDQRGGVGEQERAADALEDAPEDQLVPLPAKPAPSDASAKSRKPPT